MGLDVVVNQTLNGKAITNILRYDGQDAIISFAPEITDQIATVWAESVDNRLGPEWSLNSCTFYPSGAVPGTPGIEVVPTGGPMVGLNTDPCLPSNTALVVSLKCAGGPPFQGRLYLAGFGLSQAVTGGTWGAGTIAGAELLATGLLDLAGSGLNDIFLVVESSGTDTVPAGTRAPVTSFIARSKVGTQRRRI